MAGDSSFPFAIGTLALIIATGAAVFCLALILKKDMRRGILYISFLFFLLIWLVRLLHPTPHYVPMPGWIDMLVWLIMILCTIGVCILISKLNIKIPSSVTKMFIIFTGILALALPSHPGVEVLTSWAGTPVLKVHGCFVAGLASHRSVEPGTLVVRCALEDRARFLEDAPATYYVTDDYKPYPVVPARLSHLDRDALHDLLSVSWRMAMAKVRRPTRRADRSRVAKG